MNPSYSLDRDGNKPEITILYFIKQGITTEFRKEFRAERHHKVTIRIITRTIFHLGESRESLKNYVMHLYPN